MFSDVLNDGNDILISRAIVLNHQIATMFVRQNVIVISRHHVVLPLVQTPLQWNTPFPDVALNSSIETQFQIAIHKNPIIQ